MRPARRRRVPGREQAIDELFSTRGLEADQVARAPDQHFPLRPFAAIVPQDDHVNTDAKSAESRVERLFRRAAEATERGRRADAMLRYRELLELEPGHVHARNNLALLLEAAGEHEAAVAQLTGALRNSPDDATLLVARGAIYGRLKRYPEAEADLRRVIRQQPEHPGAHFTLGLVLWRKGLPSEAAVALRRTLELQPENAAAFYYLGEALNQAGDLPGARAALQRSSELDPTHSKSFHLLGRILDRLNQPEEAREMYRRARETRPQ